jgi:hypothetical protein
MPVTEISPAALAVPPVSILQEHEREIAESVYQFALKEIAPRSMEMDRVSLMDPTIIRKFF